MALELPPPRGFTADVTSRRTFLSRARRAGFAAVALSSAGVAVAVRRSGYHVDPLRAARLRTLSPWQLVVVDAIAARVCASGLADGANDAPPTAAAVGVGEFVDEWLAASEPGVRKDLLALIATIEHGYPIACGQFHRFSSLGPAAQDQVLRALSTSSSKMLRGGFSGLKSLLMLGYYRDPRTWGVLGYDGPTKGRPPEGWVPTRGGTP